MWIVPPSIQSAFAQASGCSKKDFTPDLSTWASEAERSCSLSGKLSPSASWLRAWKKDHWLQRLSGLAISPNSLQDDFAVWWMASSLDSHVKTCLSPVVVRDLTVSDPVFSSTYSTSQTIAMRGSSFWRTSRASLLPPPPLWTKKRASSKNAPLPESWENWPTVGGMRSGSLFLRPMWVPLMGALDGSASPGARMTPHGMGGMDSTGKLGAGGEFAKQATQWMTPNCPNGWRSVSAELVASKGMTEDGQKKTVGLESQIKHWMTPRATDGSNGGPNQRGSKGDLMLPSMASQWPTPSASIANDGESPETWHARAAILKAKHGNGNGAGLPLTVASTQWPTPAARDFKGSSAEGGLTRMDGKSRMDQLANAAVFSHLGQPTVDGLDCSPDSPGSPQHSALKVNTMPRLLSARLNPYFVEWLMGWPQSWTSPIARPAYAPEEMASYRSALQVRLSCLFADPASSKAAA